MASNLKQESSALTYAKAPVELANEGSVADLIGEELGEVAGVVKDQPDFAAFLADPGIGHENRTGVLERVFGGRVNGLLFNFIRVLNEKGRLGLIGAIGQVYTRLLDLQKGKIQVDVTVAHGLDEAGLADVKNRIGTAFGKEAIIHQIVDDGIIGGMIVRVGDTLIDSSVRNQLAVMRKRMTMMDGAGSF